MNRPLEHDLSTVLATLQRRIAAGELQFDPSQAAAASALDSLLTRLETPRRASIWRPASRRMPKGLYLWGGVGRGKSMMMDIFFDAAKTENKRRVHFHAFMLDVHERIAVARKTGQGEPLKSVARDLTKDTHLLCFDEFHVTDITDAMILSRLFEAMFARGITVLATSNRHPDDLYKNGLNRALFAPFIPLLKAHLEVFEFPGQTDHRLEQIQAAPVFYTPLGPEADAGVEAAWKRLIGGAQPHQTVLTVQGRALMLERTAAGVARTSFKRLCEDALGAADYLRLSKAFQTLILENVPVLSPAERNAAKRFVTLIDALYETKTKLIMSAAAEPDALYPRGDGSFEFERTASRLIEMRGQAYLAERRILE